MDQSQRVRIPERAGREGCTYLHGKIEGHELAHRSETSERGADSDTSETSLRDRYRIICMVSVALPEPEEKGRTGVDHTLLAELVQQSLGDLVRGRDSISVKHIK